MRDPSPVLAFRASRDSYTPWVYCFISDLSFLVITFSCRSLVPTISPLCMDPCVTGFAQGNQVVPGMGAAFRQRFLMVNFFRHHVPAILQAQFTQRMAGHVSIPDLLPSPAVPFFTHRTAFILFVSFVDNLLVLLAVPPIRQVRAAWEGTGSFRFSRHSCHLFSGMKKAL